MSNILAPIVLASLLFPGPIVALSLQQVSAELIKRAHAGDTDAQVQLGTAYATGNGVPADDVEAVRWFQKAAKKGDPAGEYSLAEMYLTGRGVAANRAEAVKWMRRSAEDGDARGQYNLAAMYVQGQGVPKSNTEAALWMRKAADQGFAAGQFGLGSMYAHGTGVLEDQNEAAKWYRKAADQGEIAAINNLALLLATCPDLRIRNPNEAITWAQRAAETEPDDPRYLDTLATAYFQAGQADKAAEAERRALALKPDDYSYKKALETYEAARDR